MIPRFYYSMISHAYFSFFIDYNENTRTTGIFCMK